MVCFLLLRKKKSCLFPLLGIPPKNFSSYLRLSLVAHRSRPKGKDSKTSNSSVEWWLKKTPAKESKSDLGREGSDKGESPGGRWSAVLLGVCAGPPPSCPNQEVRAWVVAIYYFPICRCLRVASVDVLSGHFSFSEHSPTCSFHQTEKCSGRDNGLCNKQASGHLQLRLCYWRGSQTRNPMHFLHLKRQAPLPSPLCGRSSLSVFLIIL